MKFRIILPTIFLFFAILFFGVNVIGIGHGANTFDFVILSAYPTAFLTGLLESLLGGPDFLWFLLAVVAGLVQYFLIGYFIDKVLQRRRRNQTGASD